MTSNRRTKELTPEEIKRLIQQHSRIKNAKNKTGEEIRQRYYIRLAKNHDTNLCGVMIPQGAIYGCFEHWANGKTYFIIDEFSQFMAVRTEGVFAKLHWRTMKVDQGETRFYYRVFNPDFNLYGHDASNHGLKWLDIMRFMATNHITDEPTVRFMSRIEQEWKKAKAENDFNLMIEDARTDVVRVHKGTKLRFNSAIASRNVGEIPLDLWERVVGRVQSNFHTSYQEG